MTARVAIASTAAITAVAVWAQVPAHDRNFVPMDEGHLALTAVRLLEGDALYRDIHTGIFPGVYLLGALLFSLFGQDLLVTRWAQVAINAAAAALLWLVALRAVPPRWALLPPLLGVGLIFASMPVLSMMNYSALSATLGLAALLAALRYQERGRGLDGALVGLLVGACLFVKQNFGGLAAVGIATALLLGWRRSALAERSLLSLFAPIVAAGSAVLALSAGWLLAAGIFGDWFELTFLSLIGSQLADFNNPIPPILGPHPDDIRFTFLYVPSTFFDVLVRGDRFLGLALEPGLRSATIRLFYGVPLAALVLAPVLLVLRPPEDPARSRAATTIAIFAVAFFFGIFPSAVYSHLVYVLGPILLLYAVLGERLEALAGRWVFALALALSLATTGAFATMVPKVRAWYGVPSGVPGVTLQVAADQAAIHKAALEFIEACTETPDEPIFTLPILPILYSASGHPNPVKYDLLIPGAIDELGVIDRLEERRVRCIVLQRDMSLEFPPLEKVYPDLDLWVRHNYRFGKELRGGQQLWYGLKRSEPFERPRPPEPDDARGATHGGR